MVISFSTTLHEALTQIDFITYQDFTIHPHQELRTDETLNLYGKAKWDIIDQLNEKYSAIVGSKVSSKFDLYHWLAENQEDEVAYFLNEAGSNCLSHSEYLAPWKFHLWLGKKGFIIGIEQQGVGFNARAVETKKIKTNEGAAFDFFRSCNSLIFFDQPESAKVVYFAMKW